MPTAWQVGVLFTFVSLAYLVAWVVPTEHLAHDPGYGGFLWDLARGSLGRSAGPQPGTVGPSVGSVVWDASRVTLSFVLVTGAFAVSLGTLFAFVTIRAPRWRPVVRAVGVVFVSLLPILTGLYLAFYLGADWHVIRVAIGFGAFVETVFSLPGLGHTVVVAAFGNAALMAGALVAASVLTTGVSLAVDLACAATDSRFRRF